MFVNTNAVCSKNVCKHITVRVIKRKRFYWPSSSVQSLRSNGKIFLAAKLTRPTQCVVLLRYLVVENCRINQLFTSAQHLLLLILGLHVSTDHSIIFKSLICCKFQGAVHTFGIPVVFTLKLNPFVSVGG